MSKLGSSLKSAVEKYNALVGTLESRVLPAARRIGDLDPSNTGDLPAATPLESTPRVLSAAELLDGGSGGNSAPDSGGDRGTPGMT